jgi:hypothetical protein
MSRRAAKRANAERAAIVASAGQTAAGTIWRGAADCFLVLQYHRGGQGVCSAANVLRAVNAVTFVDAWLTRVFGTAVCTNEASSEATQKFHTPERSSVRK